MANKAPLCNYSGVVKELQSGDSVSGSITGNSATVTNATLTTALTVNTGTVTLTGDSGNTSALTIGSGAVSVSGVNTGDNAGVTSVSGTAPVVSSGGNTPDISMAAATASVNGYMTSTYASKVDGIQAAAAAVANLTGTAETVGGTAVVGVATTSARSDHKHAITKPAIDTLAAATDITTLNASTTAHGLVVKATAPASGLYNYVGITNGETVYTNKALFDATSPTTQAFSDAADVGTSTVAARRDHKHAMPAAPTSVSGNAGTVTNATLTTALTVNTGTVTLTGNSGNTSALTIGAGAVSVSGSNTGDVTLAATNHGLGLTNQVITLGTPSTLTTATTNAVTGTSHTHAITESIDMIGNGAAQYQIPVTGATPFTPVWTTATGTGAPVLATSPALVTPALGTPSSGVLTNCSGTAASLTAGTANALTTSNTYQVANLGVGTAPVTQYDVVLSDSITGNVNRFGVAHNGVIQSDVTTSVNGFYSKPSTQAAAFTLSSLAHFYANGVTIGSGSTVTSQYGFRASSISTATNNYGFYGNMSAGATTWNLYMTSTAKNYFGGPVLIGSTTDDGVNKFQLTGSATCTGQITSTLATGTAPFVVASTTNVANLNASSLSGATFAAPGTIGDTTPAQATFTNVIIDTNAYIAQPAPTAETASNTTTIAKLLTRIITVTSASAVTITLPTGTLMDAGILSGGLPNGGSFDWNLINLGSSSGAVTVAAGTAHTVVGNMTVAIATSAGFRTRKTATNTFVTYRTY